jgi:hypothetical protein
MESFLPFNKADVGDEEIAEVVDVLRSGWLTTGPKAKEFEREFAAMVGTQHAVAVNSCTAALHLALEAAGLREGDEVLVPTMTFAATAEVVTYFKARPVLIDCVQDTLNLDTDRIEEAITEKTKAIIPVHFAGHPCDMEQVQSIARVHGLHVIEDAAHALPARYKGKMVGGIADFTCFSFYATKSITTGEGGMIVTNDAPLAARLAQAGKRVLVLEAGVDPGADPALESSSEELTAAENERAIFHCPGFHAAASEPERYNTTSEGDRMSWHFAARHLSDELQKDDPKAEAYDGRKVFYPRCSSIGGCTSHNTMVTICGNDFDWQRIADLTGDPSWNPSRMRYYFKRLERARYTRFRFTWIGKVIDQKPAAGTTGAIEHPLPTWVGPVAGLLSGVAFGARTWKVTIRSG